MIIRIEHKYEKLRRYLKKCLGRIQLKSSDTRLMVIQKKTLLNLVKVNLSEKNFNRNKEKILSRKKGIY